MGFKVKSDVPPMERELIYLLYDLCTKWGFCIPPDDANRIAKQPFYKAIDFAIDVVEAEGMEATPDTSWVKGIAMRFKVRFGADEIHKNTFVDRVRGQKEDWGSSNY